MTSPSCHERVGPARVIDGWQHRLLCSLPGLVLVVGLSVELRHTGQALGIFPIAGAAVWALLGFLAPMILIAGFEKSIPRSDALALCSQRVQRALFWLGMLLLVGPGVCRLLARLVALV